MRRSRWFFVFIIVGILLLLVGIATGVSSRSSTYKPLAKGTIAHYLSADGTGYLQLNGSRDLYIVQEGTFSPPINGINTFQDGDTISLIIDPKSTANIDKTSVIGTHLVGTAANVVQIMIFDDASGQPKTTYATNTYKQDHNGYTQNNWPIAGIVAFLGLLMAGGAFFMPSRKPQPAVAITPTSPPTTFGRQPMAGPFNAPFQGSPQYQSQSPLQRQPGLPSYQQSAAPAFDTNTNTFGQPQPGQPMPSYEQSAASAFGTNTSANNNLADQLPVEQNVSPNQQPAIHFLGIKNQIKAIPQAQQQSPYPSPQGPSGLLKRYAAANANTSPTQQPAQPTGLEPTQRAHLSGEQEPTQQAHPYQ